MLAFKTPEAPKRGGGLDILKPEKIMKVWKNIKMQELQNIAKKIMC